MKPKNKEKGIKKRDPRDKRRNFFDKSKNVREVTEATSATQHRN